MDAQFMYNLTMGSNISIAHINEFYCLYYGDSCHTFEY